MESHNLDKQLREKLQNDTSHYTTEAESAKNRIWNYISSEIGKPSANKWAYAVASAIIVIILSSFYYFSLQKKNEEITRLSENITNLSDSVKTQQNAITSYNNQILQNTEHQAFVSNTLPNHNVEPQIIERIKIVKDTVVIYQTIEQPYEATNVADTTWKTIVVVDTTYYQEQIRKNDFQSKEFILTDNKDAKSKDTKSTNTFKLKFGNGPESTKSTSDKQVFQINL